ncbi:MAG: hypothetical protein M0Z94_18570 [Dehalococcoidales bacterium]|nr:hypothetical protein [Dehalococcoidales bacterium]
MVLQRLFVGLSICAGLFVTVFLLLQSYYVVIALLIAALMVGYREVWSLLRWRRLPPFDERVQENMAGALRNGFVFFVLASAFLTALFGLVSVPGSAVGYVVGGLLIAGTAAYALSYLYFDRVKLTSSERGLRMLKAFLAVAGGSICLFVVGVVLHNAISALLNVEEAVFFLLAVIVAPLAFAIGVLGSAALFVKGLFSRAEQ